jgi:hypothetical protein
MGSMIREVVIDCVDPDVVARFWSEVLGWEVKRDGEWLWMSESGEDVPSNLVLVFASVPENKSVKNRLHIDLSPYGSDQATEVERLYALGARRARVGRGDHSWLVLTDPEGNEFCLLAHPVT